MDKDTVKDTVMPGAALNDEDVYVAKPGGGFENVRKAPGQAAHAPAVKRALRKLIRKQIRKP